MSFRLCSQLELELAKRIFWDSKRPWGMRRRSNFRVHEKQAKARVERRRSRLDPECQPLYNKFKGWEY